jgi:uncharacterized protein (DUF2141 family)
LFRAELLLYGAVLGLGLSGLCGCAAISAPQGGPKDVVAPRLLRTSPDSAARNVKQRFVRLEFSEPVQVKELSKNLLITPQLPPDNPYKLREERNSVTLIFDKPLDENTTYSFNFRQGIVDITESLVAKNARLSFSTGPVLDSGVVRGTASYQLTARPAADVMVGLFREADTAGVRRGRPYYLTRTDAQGNYSLDFLKAGRYQLYAIADKNNNSRYDEGEAIAYLPAPITLGEGRAALDVPLQLTRPDSRPPLITGRQPSPTQLRLSYGEGLRSATLLALASPAAAGNSPAALAEALLLSADGRTVQLFRTPAVGEGRYLLTATDSTGNVGRDTLNVTFPVPGTAARKAVAGPLYSVEGSPRSVYRQGQVRFRFAVPVRLAAKQPIGTLVEDSLRRRPLRLPADGTLSPDRTLLTLNLDTKAAKSIVVQLDSTAISSVTGQPLRLRPLPLTLTEQAPTGSIMGTIQTKSTRFELQLLNEKLEVVERLDSPKGRFRFDQLAPGDYRLRVLIDADADGRWRGGDPALKLPAEPVFLSPKTLKLRANWEVTEALTF